MKKKFSIIIPTYNEKKNIEILIKHISKVLKKTIFEIIVVDDDSNDGTKKILDNIKSKNKRFSYHIRYNVKRSNIYRSWTRKTIYPHQIGRWRVDVHDNNGTVIGSINFEIKRSSN